MSQALVCNKCSTVALLNAASRWYRIDTHSADEAYLFTGPMKPRLTGDYCSARCVADAADNRAAGEDEQNAAVAEYTEKRRSAGIS